MRFTTIVREPSGQHQAVAVDGSSFMSFELPSHRTPTMRDLTALDKESLQGVARHVHRQADSAWRPLSDVPLGPAIPDPGAVYTVGLNYDGPGAEPRPDRPLIFGKATSSVAGHRATLTWDRALTANVDAECELGVVIGADGGVFGYTIINDVSSRDPWLDGDQWLLGKSMPGFCPVGPVIVTAEELDPAGIRIGCRLNDEAIQDGWTSDMRFSVAEIVDYLSRHMTLRPGDLIASGTPVRLSMPPGPDRHLQIGDVVTCWIDGIGELMTTIG